MKRFLNGAYILLAILGGLWLNAEIILKGIVPLRPVQNFLQQKVTDLAGRPVEMKRVVLRLSGIGMEDVRLAHSSKMQETEDLFSAKEIFIRWNLWYLLKGHIQVDSVLLDQLSARIVRYADGSFNFDGLFSSSATSEAKEKEEKEEKEVWVPSISLNNFTIQDGFFSFSDEYKGEKVELSDVYVSVQDFAFDKFFPLSINADILYQNASLPLQQIEMGFTSKIHLQKMDLTWAEVWLKHGVIKHEGGVLILEGKIKNFQRPQMTLTLEGKNVNQKIADFLVPDIAEFLIKKFTLDVQASADLEKESIDISAFKFSALDSFISFLGNFSWSEAIDFAIDAETKLNLSSISQALPLLQPYQLGGEVLAAAQATQQQAKADISLKSISAYAPIVGTLKEFNTQIVLESLQKLKIEKFTGLLNDGSFEGDLAVDKTPEDITVVANFKAARLALPTPKQQKESTAQKTEKQDSAVVFPPIHAKVNIDISSLDAPFIYGKDIHFAMDMQHITTALSKAYGKLSLHAGQGEIKDLNKLTNANAVTKVMFSSLKVVSDVINSLNVFGVLSSIGNNMTNTQDERAGDMVVQTVLDENGNEIQIMIPHNSEKIDGRWAFEQFASDITFNEGIADIKRGSFVSDMLSFNLRGEMNFQTQNLDMQVNAAPGRHYEGGIMPLTLDIGGTMASPEGKMNLSSSVFSTVTQGVGNNFVSRSVKKIFSGIGSLFKKKETNESDNK